MWSNFGSRATADRSELWSYLDPDGRSDVVVYHSGHGASGLEDKRGYVLPVNSDPNTAELNGYPIDVLYENLSNLEEARSVTGRRRGRWVKLASLSHFGNQEETAWRTPSQSTGNPTEPVVSG